MNRLDRYIARSLMSATLLAWLVVVALEGLFAFLGELGDIGRGQYGWQDALLFVLLSLPAKAWQSFPMAVLIGTLLGLGNLAALGELNAFRLAGCSQLRLGFSVLFSGVLMLLVAVPLGEVVAPVASQSANSHRTQAIFNNEVGVHGGNGFWVRKGQRMIHVRRAELDGSLSDIQIYALDEKPQIVSVSTIASAKHSVDGWTLAEVSRTRFSDQKIDVESFQQVLAAQLVDPQLALLLAHRADTFSLPDLLRYIDGLERGGMQVEPYRLEFWKRLTAPLAVLAMLLLSIGLVMGSLGRQGLGLRVLVGVLLGLIFKLGSQTVAHAGLVYGGQPWIVALLPSLLVFMAATILVRRSG